MSTTTSTNVTPDTVRQWVMTRPTVSIRQAANAIGVSETSLRKSIKQGTCPLPVITINSRQVIPSAALAQHLQITID